MDKGFGDIKITGSPFGKFGSPVNEEVSQIMVKKFIKSLRKFSKKQLKISLKELTTRHTFDLRNKCAEEISEASTKLQEKLETVSKSITDEFEANLRLKITNDIKDLKDDLGKFSSEVNKKIEDEVKEYRSSGYEIKFPDYITHYTSEMNHKYEKYISEVSGNIEKMFVTFKSINENYMKSIQAFETEEIFRISEEMHEKKKEIENDIKKISREFHEELLIQNSKNSNRKNDYAKEKKKSAQNKMVRVKHEGFYDVICCEESTDSESSDSDSESGWEIEEFNYEDVRDQSHKSIDNISVKNKNQMKGTEQPKDYSEADAKDPSIAGVSNFQSHKSIDNIGVKNKTIKKRSKQPKDYSKADAKDPSIAGVSNFQDKKRTTSEDAATKLKQEKKDVNGSSNEPPGPLNFKKDHFTEPSQIFSDSEYSSDSNDSFDMLEDFDDIPQLPLA